MGMGDCLRCIKYLLFIFNLIFCLIGLAILAIGIWLYVKPAETDLGLPKEIDSQRYAGIFLLIIGAIITILGFLGCCGAIFENRCLLVLFFILLLLVFLVLLAAGIVLLFMKQTVISSFETEFTRLVYEQNNTNSKNHTDAYQSLVKCCGAEHGAKDYTDQRLEVPDSCKDIDGKIYEVSCTKRFEETVSQASIKIAIAVFVTAIVALLGMIFSMMLCCAITDMA